MINDKMEQNIFKKTIFLLFLYLIIILASNKMYNNYNKSGYYSAKTQIEKVESD